MSYNMTSPAISYPNNWKEDTTYLPGGYFYVFDLYDHIPFFKTSSINHFILGGKKHTHILRNSLFFCGGLLLMLIDINHVHIRKWQINRAIHCHFIDYSDTSISPFYWSVWHVWDHFDIDHSDTFFFLSQYYWSKLTRGNILSTYSHCF